MKHITAAVSCSHGELLFLLQEGRPDSDSATKWAMWWTQQEVFMLAIRPVCGAEKEEERVNAH